MKPINIPIRFFNKKKKITEKYREPLPGPSARTPAGHLRGPKVIAVAQVWRSSPRGVWGPGIPSDHFGIPVLWGNSAPEVYRMGENRLWSEQLSALLRRSRLPHCVAPADYRTGPGVSAAGLFSCVFLCVLWPSPPLWWCPPNLWAMLDSCLG